MCDSLLFYFIAMALRSWRQPANTFCIKIHAKIRVYKSTSTFLIQFNLSWKMKNLLLTRTAWSDIEFKLVQLWIWCRNRPNNPHRIWSNLCTRKYWGIWPLLHHYWWGLSVYVHFWALTMERWRITKCRLDFYAFKFIFSSEIDKYSIFPLRICWANNTHSAFDSLLAHKCHTVVLQINKIRKKSFVAGVTAIATRASKKVFS